jgi:hypothetical protein
MAEQLTRRVLIGIAAASPLLLLAFDASAQDASPCVNLDALPMGQKGMRRSLNFKLQSSDPAKRCATCAFFTAASGGCGKCQLLSGGAVGSTSVCDSWTKKG